MAAMKANPKRGRVDRVKELLSQLTPQELQDVLGSLRNRMESLQMMKLAESAFAEWDKEEELYSNG